MKTIYVLLLVVASGWLLALICKCASCAGDETAETDVYYSDLCAKVPSMKSTIWSSLSRQKTKNILDFKIYAIKTSAYTFTKCSLATTLVSAGVARSDVHKWVCMAYAESRYDTMAHHVNNDGSADHGIFQINDYWNCDPRNGRQTKNGCKQPCSDFENSSLNDDVRCIKTLLGWQNHDMSQVSYGYAAHCQSVSASYLSGCTY